ncbi:uncharacterized protein LOC143229267 [Tachypleus tridentatus]|uniref:uncharacterized protein LOC143229267 n=1 Tax=Tachypleus tridentatus TaxID=6853 RepID=UPI003FCFE752
MKSVLLVVGLIATVAGQGFVYLFENQQEDTPDPSNNLFNPDNYVYKPPSALNQGILPAQQPRLSPPTTRRRSFQEHPEDQRQRTPQEQARRVPPQSSEVQHKPIRSPAGRLPPQYQPEPVVDPSRRVQTSEIPTARHSGQQATFPASTTSRGGSSIEDIYASLERRVDEYDKKQREQKRLRSSFAPSTRMRSEGRAISTRSQPARSQQHYNTYSQQYRNIQTQPTKPLSHTNTYQEQYYNNQQGQSRPVQSSQQPNTYQEQYNNNQQRQTRRDQRLRQANTYQEQYNNNQHRQTRPDQHLRQANSYQEQYNNNQQRQTPRAQHLRQANSYQEQYNNNQQRQTRPDQHLRQANSYQEQYNNNQQRQTRPDQHLRQANSYQEQYNNNQQRESRPAQSIRQANTYQEQYNNNQQRDSRPAQSIRQANTYQEQYNNDQQRESRPAQPFRQANTYQEQYNNNQQRESRPAQSFRQANTYQEQYNNNQQRQDRHTQQDANYYQQQYNNNQYRQDQFSQPQHQSVTYQQQYGNNRQSRVSNHAQQEDYSYTSPNVMSQNYNSSRPSIFAGQLVSPGLPASTIPDDGSTSIVKFYAELERSAIESQKQQKMLQLRESSRRQKNVQTTQAQYYPSNDVTNHPSYTASFVDQQQSRQQRVRQRRSTVTETHAVQEYTDNRRYVSPGRAGGKLLSAPVKTAKETQLNPYEANRNYANLAVSLKHSDSDTDGIRDYFKMGYSMLVSIPQTDTNLLGNINI